MLYQQAPTLRTPFGGMLKILRCSACATIECSSSTWYVLRPMMGDAVSVSFSRMISSQPGKNTRMAPSPT